MQNKVSAGHRAPPSPQGTPAAPGAGEAPLQFRAPRDGGPVIVELALENRIYLHDARLTLSLDGNASSCDIAFRSRSIAVWRQVALRAGQGGTLVLSWTAVADAAPDEPYSCQISVRDACGSMLATAAGGTNPACLYRRIGTADQPVDHGQALLTLVQSGEAIIFG